MAESGMTAFARESVESCLGSAWSQTIIVYPIVFAIMPKLWAVAYRNGYVTAADVVHGRYGSRPLELAVALTGVLATMPYIPCGPAE